MNEEKEGVMVYWSGDYQDCAHISTKQEAEDTYKGLLTNITEIKPKSREKLLEEKLEDAISLYGTDSAFWKDARKLLGYEGMR